MKRVFLSLVGWALISSIAGIASIAAAPRDGANEAQVSAGFFHAQDSDSGNLSIEFASDGSVLIGGTARGWGARGGKPFALQRLVWTGKVPFEIHEMRVKPDGFELTFTRPVDRKTVEALNSYRMETYTYIYQSSYGSPEVDQATPLLERAQAAEDGMSVRIRVNGLQLGHVHELHLDGIRSRAGEPLLHQVVYYTLNAIPEK